MASSSRHSLYYVEESTYGNTPTASPSFSFLRHTDASPQLSKEALLSNEMYADREIRHFKHGVKSTGGEVPFELTYGSFDDLLEAALCGTWATDVLEIGTTRRSFTLLRHFEDLDAADEPYHFYRGMEVNGVNLTFNPSGLVTGSFSFVGKGVAEPLQDLSSLTTPTLGTPNTNKPFNNFSGSLTEGGSALAVGTELSLSLVNGLTPRYVLGSDESILPSIGRANLTGSLTAYFEDSSLFSKFIDETETAIVYQVTDADGNSYTFNIPKLKYSGSAQDTSGEAEITDPLPFQAYRDPTLTTTLRITRASA